MKVTNIDMYLHPVLACYQFKLFENFDFDISCLTRNLKIDLSECPHALVHKRAGLHPSLTCIATRGE